MGDPAARTNRRITIGCLSLYSLLVGGLLWLMFAPGPSFDKDGNHVDFVERVVAVDPQVAHERLVLGLTEEVASHPKFGGWGFAVADAAGRFPTQFQIESKVTNNVALGRYAKRGKEVRTRDFYVEGPWADWHSEYLRRGKRLPFNTDFIVHLKSAEHNTTRIEVLEYAPEVTVGLDFHFCGRHLVPGISSDTRPVAPTTGDRREMLEIVLRVVEREPPRPKRPPNSGE